MKLVVLGGAGVRAPLLMPALARRQQTIDLTEVVLVDQGEGYAGVGVDILAAEAGQGGDVTVNVANRGAIPGMNDDDIVEVTCRCDAAGLHPIAMEPPAEDQLLLMKQVKRYERLAVEAIEARSQQVATQALMAHPLIGSYSTARSLVDAYPQAHRQYVGDWTTW